MRSTGYASYNAQCSAVFDWRISILAVVPSAVRCRTALLLLFLDRGIANEVETYCCWDQHWSPPWHSTWSRFLGTQSPLQPLFCIATQTKALGIRISWRISLKPSGARQSLFLPCLKRSLVQSKVSEHLETYRHNIAPFNNHEYKFLMTDRF